MKKTLFKGCLAILGLLLVSSFVVAGDMAAPDEGSAEALMMMEVAQGPFSSLDEAKAKYKNGIPQDLIVLPQQESDAEPSYFVLKSAPVISTIDVMEARIEDMHGHPAIGVSLSDAGAVKLGTFTEANIGKRLAIVLFGKVVSAPVIRAKISRNALITGQFSMEEAEKTLKKINEALH